MDLFEYARSTSLKSEAPLASRIRPKTLEEVLGIKYQSINTTLKAADIFNIRNLSIAALEEMRRI